MHSNQVGRGRVVNRPIGRPLFRSFMALLLAWLLFSTTERATAQQPKPADQEAVDRAIESGVRYLRQTQNALGGWGEGKGPGSGAGWGIGYTSLAGIALIECGVPTTDPGLQRAAYRVREEAGKLDTTYEVSLAILFLDRMGDKRDTRLIQYLAGRLIAGQTGTGGWGYSVPKLGNAELDGLFVALRKITVTVPAPPPSVRARPGSLGLCIKASDDVLPKPPAPAVDLEKARTLAVKAAPASVANLAALQNPSFLPLAEDPKGKDPLTAGTDNSNTHFATLALWAARRHDVPAERSFMLLVRRFRTSQSGDGMWGYAYVKGGGGGSPQMTCVALLGIAIGHVVDPDAAVRPEADPKILKAFAALGRHIQPPAGTTVGRPAVKDIGGLYFLFAMERIAVLYDVKQLDKKDWYLWGAEILVGRQSPDGSWSEEGGYHGQHPALNTSFALLFLKRANLTPDLARRLTVDTSALSEKVSGPVEPKVEPKPKTEPLPTSKVDPEPEPKTVPVPKIDPQPKTEPQPKIDPTQPTGTPPIATPPTASQSTSEPKKESSSKLPWIILLILLVLLLVGGGGYFYVRQSKLKAAAAAEEAARKKRKKKGKAAVVDDVEVEEEE